MVIQYVINKVSQSTTDAKSRQFCEWGHQSMSYCSATETWYDIKNCIIKNMNKQKI